MFNVKLIVIFMLFLVGLIFIMEGTSDTTVFSDRNVEFAVLEKVNLERVSNGLSELEWSDQAALVARQHSKAMVEQNFFSHDNPNGLSFSERMSNLNAVGAGENILQMSSMFGKETIEGESVLSVEKMSSKSVSMWMQSPGHKKNILTGNFKKSGVGVYYSSSKDAYYFTQVFLA